MAISGSVDYIVTRDNIIEDALRLIGALGVSQSASSADLTVCSRFLNSMVKAWQADGLNLWTTFEGAVFTNANQVRYDLSEATGDTGVTIATAAESVTYETRLAVAASSSQMQLTVDSTTNMTEGWTVVIELDDGTFDENVIDSIDSATLVTLTSGLAGAASVDNRVTFYQTSLLRPLDIFDIRYRDANDVEIQLSALSRDDYMQKPVKNTVGRPTSFFFDSQMITSYLYIWPVPDTSEGILRITGTRVINDFDSASDNPDLPVEWSEALTYNLAMRIAPMYGKGDIVVQTIGPMAQAFKEDLLRWDSEKRQLSILPDEY